MITVIGKLGCNSCIELKGRLTEQGIEFDYKVFEELERGERKFYAYIIRVENEGRFPLMLDENRIVIKEIKQ